MMCELMPMQFRIHTHHPAIRTSLYRAAGVRTAAREVRRSAEAGSSAPAVVFPDCCDCAPASDRVGNFMNLCETDRVLASRAVLTAESTR
jgi:hypothetical protein